MYFGYEHSVGSCSAWSQFLKTKEVTSFLTIRIVESVRLTTVKLLYDHYELVDGSPETIVCSNRNDSELILRRLAGKIEGNATIVCDENNWKFKNCGGSVPGICVNCDDPCVQHCSNARDVNYITPCVTNDVCTDPSGKRSGIRNSLHVLSVISSDKYPPPDIISVATTVARTSASISVSFEYPGGVYCGVFDAGTVPQSLDVIRFQNNVVVANSTVAAVFIDSLLPATAYSAYCFTFAETGAAMTYANMLQQGVANFTTACCKDIVLSATSRFLFQDKNYEDFLRVDLGSLPNQNVNVNVSVLHESQVKRIFFPKLLSFTSSSPSLHKAYSLSTSGLGTGLYTFITQLSGVGAGDFSVTYSEDVTSFTIYASDVEPPSPTILSAVFSNSGSFVTVKFDSATNRAGLASTFVCSQAL
ncbi:hypothetical protein B484DRAFT_439796, partial [Ochromonadaceae sp. CCMP2298]